MSERATETVAFSDRISQYGTDEPLPRRFRLRAGPFTAVLEGGDLRYVTLGPDLVVLRLYTAIRDQNWNTVAPEFLAYEMDRRDDSFTVRFVAENVSADVDFEWAGEISGTADGVITATMDGFARKDFHKNRIGWCVLHPMQLAGTAATVETPDREVTGAFPDLISPHQPFLDMQAIRHGTPAGGEVVIRFEGDLFEMEDQRNWTDASYKTYSTPLRLPYPAQIHKGDRVWQRVTIAAEGGQPAAEETGRPLRVTLDPARPRHLPPIGLGAAGHGAPMAERDAALIRAIQPAHIHVALDLTQSGWQDRLRQAVAEAIVLPAALEVEAVAGAAGAGLEDLARELARGGVEVARVLVFPHNDLVSTEAVLDDAREALQEAGVATLLGGGSRAYFTELNRATLPLAAMDVAGYTLNPQVHAFDIASITESLAAQAETVRSARAIVGERPLAVGPITLSPRFNPNATGPEPPPLPGELPSSVDHRQPSLFAAGWLAGSINALANAGADSLTYLETTGWKGLIERRDHPLRLPRFHSWPGMVFPIYHVLADVGEFRHGDVLPVTLEDGLRVQALALRDDERVRVILANMSEEPALVALQVPGFRSATLRRLDAENVQHAATEPEAYRAEAQPIDVTDANISIELPPFALATIDGQVTA